MTAVARPDSAAPVLVEVAEGIAWIQLNRPDAGNSRNQAMRELLLAAYRDLEQDPAVRVLVLTGAGDRFFCAGMDLKEAALPAAPGSTRERLLGARDIEALAHFPRPTIAAVNGYALGGGCEMALACDLRVMADEASIGLTEVRHGLIPGGGGAQRLPRLVGGARALELLYLARTLSGQEALAIGLVNRSVPRDQLTATTEALAAELVAMPAEALALAKASALRGQELPLTAAIDADLDALIGILEERAAR